MAYTHEWSTPQYFFDMLNDEFHFSVDVCSTHENAKCEKHYTKEEDGLIQDWGGRKCFAIRHMTESLIGY